MSDLNNQPDEGQVILIDKPLTWTSFDVVKKVRYTLKLKKVGHAGTLDPLATGLLILCTGKKTKQIENFMGLEKEYVGKFVIGKTTPSVDLETAFDSERSWEHISKEDCEEAAEKLSGEISQVPPAHSAVRIKGTRAYKMARKGEKVEIKPRNVLITEFSLPVINLPEVHFKVICSKGTYIRSLARDFGEILGTGAYLAELRRTRIGDYNVKDSLSINQISILV
jgi:tRNA pseudouridine55 synthase